MTSHPLRRLLVVFIALGLILAACGDDDGDASPSSTTDTSTTDTGDDTGDDDTTDDTTDTGDDPERDAYVAALTAELSADTDFEGAEDAGDCLAAVLIDTVGVDQLIDEGIEVDDFVAANSLAELGIDLDDGQLDQLTDGIDGCLDLRQLMLDSAPDGYGCLMDTVDQSVLSRALAEEFASGESFDPSVAMFEAATPACAEEVFLATGVAQGDITTEQAACVADDLDDQVAVRILQAVADTGNPAQADREALEASFAACGVSP